MSNELDIIRVCALLHDIGKLQCWALGRSWVEHALYTYKFVESCLGGDIAEHAMRHHFSSACKEDYKPKVEIEKIICLANNIASGADKTQEPTFEQSVSSPPVKLTHVLSKDMVRREFDASELINLSLLLSEKLGNLRKEFEENSKETYLKIFESLSSSDLRFVPANTIDPINDVSLWNHMKLTAAFATCIYRDSGWKGDDLEKYKFTLLSGDADRISNFINESLRLPDLNARSSLINEATYSACKYLSDILGPECVLFASGGSFLAISPVNTAEETLRETKKRFEETSDGQVTITVSYVIANGENFRSNFGNIWKEAQRKIRIEKSGRLLVPSMKVDEEVETCDVCKKRQWMFEDPERLLPADPLPRHERLCSACWSLRSKGRGIWLNDLKKGTNFVACIKADGDDVGKVLSGETFKKAGKACTPSRISTISDIIHGTCEKEFAEILRKFDIRGLIYSGGDDLLAFTPGEYALKVSRELALDYRKAMADECTMSAGIAIFHYKLPAYVGVESAGRLLSKAKREGKNRVAYAVIGGSGITGSELEKVKTRSWSELDTILNIIEFMRESGFASTQLRRIAKAAAESRVNGEGYVKAEILIKYLMGREVIDWQFGEKMLSYLKTGLLTEAFLIYNLLEGEKHD